MCQAGLSVTDKKRRHTKTVMQMQCTRVLGLNFCLHANLAPKKAVGGLASPSLLLTIGHRLDFLDLGLGLPWANVILSPCTETSPGRA